MVTKNLRKVSSVMVMTVTPNTKNVTLLIVGILIVWNVGIQLHAGHPSPSRILLFSSTISLIDKMKPVMRKNKYSIFLCCHNLPDIFPQFFDENNQYLLVGRHSPGSVMTLICINTDPGHKSINQSDIALHQGPIMPAKIEYLNTGVTDN